MLLQDTLTVDGAIQVALPNNRDLQALYAELGVAQANLVQAGLLRNPIFDASVFFPVAGGQPDLELGVAMSFLDIFYLPLWKRMAAARFEEAKLVERSLQLRAILDAPPLDRGVRALNPTCCPEGCDVVGAQRVGNIPAAPPAGGKCAPGQRITSVSLPHGAS